MERSRLTYYRYVFPGITSPTSATMSGWATPGETSTPGTAAEKKGNQDEEIATGSEFMSQGPKLKP